MVILTGAQASNESFTLGNYIGMGMNFLNVAQQNPNATIFLMIADLHALTTQFQNPSLIQRSTKNIYKFYKYLTKDLKNVYIFRQSQISAHAELFWILNSITSLGHLERMTQYKDKTINFSKDKINAGLLTYPILQVADIVLYDANFVPVGIDQKQHIEFARDIAIKFNNLIGQDIFTIPEPMIQEQTAKIMSLQDGTKKMSKSDESDMSRINLLDSNEVIGNKIKKAKTDSITGIYYDLENRPEVSNLLNIFSILSQIDIKTLEMKYKNSKTGQFKDDLANIITQHIAPVREFISNDNIQFNASDEKHVSQMANDKLQIIKKILFG